MREIFMSGSRRHHARSSLLHPAATPLGSLTLAEAPLIDAENLFRQPGPPLTKTSTVGGKRPSHTGVSHSQPLLVPRSPQQSHAKPSSMPSSRHSKLSSRL